MTLDYIAFAVPFFLFFLFLEYYISKRQNKNIHQFNESIANINVGIVERITDLITTSSFYFVFSWLYTNFAIFHIESSIITWILLFLATDFIWYWYHRSGHRINLFWAAHIVHHQSDDFNYTAAARITVFQAIARGSFWSVLPIIGFQPEMIFTLLLVHGTYPFFTHTQLVGKLGWIEYIFVTPSHHRIHHSSNNEYLDKNFGDVLIIWDKLFGTFAQETVQPKYGLTKSLESHSFLWQQFHYVLELYLAFKLAKTFRQKLRVVFGKPEDIDPRIRTLLEKKLSQKNSTPSYNKNLLTAIKVKTSFTVLILFFSILFSHYLNSLHLFFITTIIILSVIITGAMLEQKQWIYHLEFVRFSLICLLLATFFPIDYVIGLSLVFVIIWVLFHNSLQSKYQEFLFQPI